LAESDGEDLTHRLADAVSFPCGAPIAPAGLIWPVVVTDLSLIQELWPLLLLLLGVVSGENWPYDVVRLAPRDTLCSTPTASR